ncbi:GNAT family N-acetyltransferase [Streptomyces sp. NBRC 109706]|uniref:GNAT family N-acetyltransferase n=1 Tax=Streptomyces sp. NBRC 109706 TaxID=1550035 RepID=UPI000783A8E4|nr:GNAT family N-acetyltransferase [Streptomyces sp. NBRC 109706]
MSSLSAHELTVTSVRLSDPLTLPLLRELEHEYTSRYGAAANGEMSRYPEAEFAPPDGLLLLLLHEGNAVAGGAYRRYDAHTAELKRIWTHSAHRRQGLARRVVAELERAAARHYRRIRLTTGPRQPEARLLYLDSGYTPLFDVTADPETLPYLPFEKHLVPAPPVPHHDQRRSDRSYRPEAP